MATGTKATENYTLYTVLKNALYSQSKPAIKCAIELWQEYGDKQYRELPYTEYSRRMSDKRITAKKWDINALLSTFCRDYDYYENCMYTRGKKLTPDILTKTSGTLKIIGFSAAREWYNKKAGTDEKATNNAAIVYCDSDLGGCGNYNITRIKEFNQKTSGAESCGCIKSHGERLLLQLLREIGAGFEYQRKYADMRGVNGGMLSTDFEVYSDMVSAGRFGLEYDGPQHNKVTGGWNTPEKYAEQQANRAKKIEYYQKMGIGLACVSSRADIVPDIIDADYITARGLWLVEPER